jgi:hypothetical protein
LRNGSRETGGVPGQRRRYRQGRRNVGTDPGGVDDIRMLQTVKAR